MDRQEIVRLFAQRHEAVARHDAVEASMFYADNCVLVSPTAGGTVHGRAAVRQVYEAWFKAFPDVVPTREDLLVDGDRVAEVTSVAGSDTGGFMGLPPTGKPFKLTMFVVCAVKDAKIVHERRIYDYTGMLVQIGVLKAKPA
jgi:predicted ester cyclase